MAGAKAPLWAEEDRNGRAAFQRAGRAPRFVGQIAGMRRAATFCGHEVSEPGDLRALVRIIPPRMELRRTPSWLLALFAAALAFANAALAQGSVEIQTKVTPQPAQPGAEVTLELTVTVSPGYHAYGTKEETNVPVRIEDWKVEGCERVGDPAIPTGDKKSAFGVDSYPLPETFRITQKLKAGAGGVVEGVLHYQLCDENSCEMPSQKSFSAKVEVAAGGGQEPQQPAPKKPKPVVSKDGRITLVATPQPSSARSGESVTLTLDVTVEEGFHAYGTKEGTGIPVAIKPEKLKLTGLRRDGDAVIPPGEEKEEAFGTKTFPLPQQFRVAQKFVVEAEAGTTAKGEGEFAYQVCDENGCEMPQSVAFTFEVAVEAGAARASSATTSQPKASSDGDDNSLWALILACIGGGLFALVMPCTYPMIPITFSFFTKQADARGGKVLSLALAYGFGIVAMFTVIGALAGQLGQHIVPFAAHWITNTVIGTAFVVFGLSLLGVFVLQPPRFLMDAAGKTRKAGGIVGVLMMGATLVISSFTCTAPVVALLLVPAVQSGETWRATVGMAVFGLTMATPFVLLALLPGRVKQLPRSGDWMNTLKVSLGFVELAAALKFFSNAEYVEELHILPRETFFGIWIAIFVALAGFLWGIVPRASVGNGRRVGGLASVVFAGYCLYGALGYPLDFVMTALAPAYGARDVSRHELVVDDYEKARALAEKQGKLLLVNLTGFTCTNCRMVERGILPADAIAQILERHFVEARLHMDNESAIPADKWKVHTQLRQDLVQGRVTTPTYCSVDPKTGALVVEHVLKGGPSAWEAGYLEFLNKSLALAGRAVPGK